MTTDIHIIINEEDLTILRDNEGNPYKFKSKEAANYFASGKCNLWKITRIHFNHEYINHSI